MKTLILNKPIWVILFILLQIFYCGNVCLASSSTKNRVSIYVERLRNASNEAEKEKIKSFLVDYVLSPYLIEHKKVIIPLLLDFDKSEASCVLIGALEPNDELIKEILSSPVAPDMLKAKYGNESSMRNVINRFTNSNSIPELRKNAIEMLYVGGERVSAVYADSLSSKDVIEEFSGTLVTKVYILVQCYSLVDPDEELISPENLLKYNTNSKGVILTEGYHNYLKLLSEYFSNKFERMVVIDVPYLRKGDLFLHEYIEPSQ
jgi:hypothetical protein